MHNCKFRKSHSRTSISFIYLRKSLTEFEWPFVFLCEVTLSVILSVMDGQSLNIWDIALRRHYALNRHHPEHFSVGEMSETDRRETLRSLMSETDRREMLCDLLSCALTEQHPAEWTISEAAAICRHWSKWLYVSDLYTGDFTVREPCARGRWDHGLDLSLEKGPLTEDARLLYTGSPRSPTAEQLEQRYSSVRYYLADLQLHQSYIVHVAERLFPGDAALRRVCRCHDADKRDPFMIAAYTLAFCCGLKIISL